MAYSCALNLNIYCKHLRSLVFSFQGLQNRVSYCFVPLELVLGRFHGLDIPDQDFHGSMSVIRFLGVFKVNMKYSLWVENIGVICILLFMTMFLEKLRRWSDTGRVNSRGWDFWIVVELREEHTPPGRKERWKERTGHAPSPFATNPMTTLP